MTPKEYMTNPMGKGSTVASSSVRDNLDKEFETIRHNMRLDRFLVKGHRLIFHVQLPSRSITNLKYNIIIEFDLEQNPGAKNISELNFMCFSNCPSFVYTYAYVFYYKHMIPTWVQNKYPREVLNNAPEMRNQYQVTFYERSLYLALKYITQKSYSDIAGSKGMAMNLESTQTLHHVIATVDEIMSIHSRTKAKVAEKDKKPERKPTKKSTPKWGSGSSVAQTKSVKSAGSTTKSTKTTVTQSNKTKKTKKI